MKDYDSKQKPSKTLRDYVVPIAKMGREELKGEIMKFKGFELDFTESYLNKVSVGRLRHIYLAISIHKDEHK